MTARPTRPEQPARHPGREARYGANMTPRDSNLLQTLQRCVPLVPRPFDALAAELDLSAAEVLAKIASWRSAGLLREISAIFDVARLGYQQALVAMKIPAGSIDSAGLRIAQHPGVSHCYSRQGDYNLWFTLAVSPQSALGLSKTVDRLAAAVAAAQTLILPTLRQYKLSVRFAPGAPAGDEERSAGQTAPRASAPIPALSDEQRRAAAALQTDLPGESEPFVPLAKSASMSVERLLEIGREFIAQGAMRRYAAVLHHRRAGAQANVMVTWEVPPGQADDAGAAAAALPAVSHCYLRPTMPHWPYNLYTMIHGRSVEECKTTVERLSRAMGTPRRAELWTQAEYKKQRVELFSPLERRWEETYGAF